ncbi:MAG: hypothetical protein GY854_08115, partial [Deltaproteobacteria bacterium]|nr:hypothetical protein [Deltaproteobacteria bacterium]
EYPFCVELNTMGLKHSLNLSDDQIAAFREDSSKAKLPEKERELVHFVVRSVREPEEITAQDMQRLRDLGWDDSDVLDATFMGAFMLTSGVLFNTFKMNE